MPVAGRRTFRGAIRTAIRTARIRWAEWRHLIRGCTKLGIRVSAGGPVAILAGSRGDRPHCIYRGFCIQGCKVGAKASTLITHVPTPSSTAPRCATTRWHRASSSDRTGA